MLFNGCRPSPRLSSHETSARSALNQDKVGIGYVNDVGSVKELRDRSRVEELAR